MGKAVKLPKKKIGKTAKKTAKKAFKEDTKQLKVLSAKELGIQARELGVSAKAKTHKGRKIMIARAPKVIENPKKSFIMKGRKSSETLNELMKELHMMRGPGMSQLLVRKTHDVAPMEDASFIENQAVKYDSSLFVVGSHQKKRPDNLVLGRVFDGHVLDMFEFGVENYRGMRSFRAAEHISSDLKPILLFQGEQFEVSEKHKRIKSLLIGKSYLWHHIVSRLFQDKGPEGSQH